MEYFIDKEKKYLDDLLFHLRAHNKSFTGPKEKVARHVYIYDNDQLVGYGSPGMSWDWVGCSTLYYHDVDVLKAIISESVKFFNGKFNGFKAFAQESKRRDDLLEAGFNLVHTGYAEKRIGKTYFFNLEDLNYKYEHDYKVDILEEELEEYKEVIKKYKDNYTKKHNLNVLQEDFHYVAMSNNEFAGGVFCQVYQDSLYVDLLAVNPKYKGLGIGTVLMNYAEEFARNKGFEFIDLGTAEFQARPFYEKLGYKVVYTRKEQPTGFECYSLVKFLQE